MSDSPISILQKGHCMLCTTDETSGFYLGCMVRDGHCQETGWTCDGKGNLSRPRLLTELDCGLCGAVNSATEWHPEKGWGSWCRACKAWTFHGDTPVMNQQTSEATTGG